MPVYLTVVLCLLGAPETRYNCQNVYPDQPVAGLAACGIVGQEIGAQWIAEHPGYRFAGTRCTMGSPPTKDTGEL